jgi:hypothetical protein
MFVRAWGVVTLRIFADATGTRSLRYHLIQREWALGTLRAPTAPGLRTRSPSRDPTQTSAIAISNSYRWYLRLPWGGCLDRH